MSIRIRFQPTFVEGVRVIFAVYRFQPVVRLIRWAGWTALAVGAGGLATGLISRGTALFLLSLALLIILLITLVPVMLYRLASSGNRLARGERSYLLDDDGIHTSLATAESFVRWDALDRVRETRRYFLLYSSNQCVFCLPKWAVEAPDDPVTVRDLLQLRVGRAVPARESAVRDPETIVESGITGRFHWTLRDLFRGSIEVNLYGSRQWIVFVALMAGLELWAAGPYVHEQVRRGGLGSLSVTSLFIYALPVLLILTLIPVNTWWSARRQLRNNAAAQGEQVVVVAEAGVRAWGGLFAGSWTWDSFRLVVATRTNLLFLFGKIQGVVVPLSAFPPEELDHLFSSLERAAGERFRRRPKHLRVRKQSGRG